MATDASQPAVPGGMAVGGAIEQLEDITLLLKRTSSRRTRRSVVRPRRISRREGSDTSSGGEAFGGAIDSEFFAGISGTNVTFRNNLAQRARGGNSAPNSGTEAGVGGPAQGGALEPARYGRPRPLTTAAGDRQQHPFQDNRRWPGRAAAVTEPAGGGGSGGYATGGAMQTNGIFTLQLDRTQWLNNQAIAQQGQFAFGGALGMSFGFTTSQTMITGEPVPRQSRPRRRRPPGAVHPKQLRRRDPKRQSQHHDRRNDLPQ